MTKRQVIDEILAMNPSAQPEFLARFADDDLGQYLAHLQEAHRPRLTGDAGRYEKYFPPSEWSLAGKKAIALDPAGPAHDDHETNDLADASLPLLHATAGHHDYDRPGG